MKTGKILLFCCFSIIFSSLAAAIKVPAIFSDNMILQRDKVITIWGWADKNELVEIQFANQTKKTKADKNGNWLVQLDPLSSGGPYMLTIRGKSNSISFQNILMGEVWFCSGQSNMEWTVKNVQNAGVEISKANYPDIRSFNVTKALSTSPKTDFEGDWEVCSPETVPDFSAVAYFFARKLNEELNVPIGIINSLWGGTDVETWISGDTFDALPERYKERYNGFKITNIEEYVKENDAKKAAYEEAMSNDPGMVGKWYETSVEASSWQKMQVPQLWENVLGDLNGIVWFRYKFNLPHDSSGKAGVLQLGPIDDDDVVWVNGIKIGETKGYTTNREYSIPQDLLVAGENTITVKVIDYYGGGGMYGKAENMYLEQAGTRYPLSGDWSYKIAVSNLEFGYKDVSPNMQPSLLYNAMINPVTKLSIRGTIWYQGENNASKAYDYQTLFPAMIKDWRGKWGYEFPFYWVQLANFMAKDKTPVDSEWAELREAQTRTLALPNTGQAIITDIGEADDIHPRNKQDVGLRLALIALNKDYGKRDVIYLGPTYKSMSINGDKVTITYDNIGSGLMVNNKYGYIEGFTIAGADKKFVWAKAYLDGNRIVVYSPSVKSPVAVRYSWANNPDVNLFNVEGLPAVPFKTDDWKWITE